VFEWEELAIAHQMLYEGKSADGRMVIEICKGVKI
jgi:hypothetical protein